jgi:antitoxin (DNA-binding transcriptional repressor) of toxin-antitoxin stability system
VSSKEAEVSAFEARTRLAELLRETAAGRSFLIRRRGKAVAQLIPPHTGTSQFSPKNVAAAFRAIRRRIKGPLKVRALIEEGRRF